LHRVVDGTGGRRLTGFEQGDGPCAFATDAVQQGEVVLPGNVQGLGDLLALVAFR
jgi:hypothetical protein